MRYFSQCRAAVNDWGYDISKFRWKFILCVEISHSRPGQRYLNRQKKSIFLLFVRSSPDVILSIECPLLLWTMLTTISYCVPWFSLLLTWWGSRCKNTRFPWLWLCVLVVVSAALKIKEHALLWRNTLTHTHIYTHVEKTLIVLHFYSHKKLSLCSCTWKHAVRWMHMLA